VKYLPDMASWESLSLTDRSWDRNGPARDIEMDDDAKPDYAHIALNGSKTRTATS